MIRAEVKRILAWLAVIAILSLFLFFSLRSYQLLTSNSKQDDIVVSVEQQAENSSGYRTNWPEVVTLLLVGGVLLYAIHRTNRSQEKKKM